MWKCVLLPALLLCFLPSVCSAHEVNPKVIEKITGETITYDHHTSVQEAPADPDPRVESRRFYTLPEWYIVYIAIEYGQFVADGGEPSQFPYFKSTNQLWELWRLAEKAAGELPDPTTNTVLYTIAISTTIEQLIIGTYEATIGWLFEYLDFGLVTPEDTFTNEVAKEYGSFLLHTPWYQFPYGEKVIGLWTTWDWASLTPRGIERRLAFTVGYGIKALYAQLINFASSQEFSGGAALVTNVSVGSGSSKLDTIPFPKIDSAVAGEQVLVLPRYRAFLPAVQQLADYDVEILSIMNNSKITFSVVKPVTASCEAIDGYTAFMLPLVTDENLHRVIYDVPVADLLAALRNAKTCNFSVEHVYDF